VRPGVDKLAALALISLGCSSRSLELRGEIPPQIEWGAVFAEAHGNPSGASGLIHRDPNGAFRMPLVGDTGDVLTFAGFSPDDLAPVASVLADADTIAQHPVRRAGPGDTVLRPSWVGTATISAGATSLSETSPGLLLTADAWLPACPSILRSPGSSIADVSCASGACPVPREVKDCALMMDLRGCGFDVLEGAIGHDGTIMFPASNSFGACSASLGTGAEELDVNCIGGTLGSCEITLYQPPFDAPLAITRQHVVDPAPGGLVSPGALSDQGHIGGMVELGSKIAVVTSVLRRTLPCDGGVPSALVFLDEETLELTPGPERPACTFSVSPDPGGSGFLALVFDSTVASIARYDASGSMRLATRNLEGAPVSSAKHYPVGMAVAVTGTSAAVGVAMMARDRQSPNFSYFLAYDGQSLARRGAAQLGSGPNDTGRAALLVSVTQGHAGGFAVLDADDTKVWLIDSFGMIPQGGRLGVPRQTMPLPDREPLRLSEVLPETVICSFGGVGETMILDTSLANPVKPFRSAIEFELAADAFAAAPWRYEPQVAIVGFTERDYGAEAFVALLDIERGKFRPGRTVVGNGLVGHMIVDRKNRVWLSLPDTGDVVRVTPR
jgi:hypothetical protein